MINPFSTFAQLADQSIAGIADLVTPVFAAESAAVAIVLVTIAVRLLLIPVAYARHRTGRHSAALAESAAALRARYPAESPKLTAELAALYQSRSGRILAGHLPLLAQIPLVAGIYQAVALPAIYGHASFAVQHAFFGVPLGSHLLALGALHVPVFLALVALLVVIAIVSSRLLRPAGPRPGGVVGLLAKVGPYVPAVIALFLPLAAALYMVTSTAWTVAENVALRSL